MFAVIIPTFHSSDEHYYSHGKILSCHRTDMAAYKAMLRRKQLGLRIVNLNDENWRADLDKLEFQLQCEVAVY